jgi:hypothetical protein
VQQIYNANYQFAVPPAMPTVKAEAGDGYVRLSWDDIAERGLDPVTAEFDFEGYRIYRSTDPDFRDPRVLTTGRGTPFVGNGKPIAQFDLRDGKRGYSTKTVEGVAYFLGAETGITHTWTDTTVVNGQDYYYAVCAYDFGSPEGTPDTLAFYPSENSIAVSRTLRGGLILPRNVVAVRPNPKVPGYVPAAAGAAAQVAGRGTGTVETRVLISGLVPEGHLFKVTFATPSPESIRARTYALADWGTDSTEGKVLFALGRDFDGLGIGPVGAGLLPVVSTPAQVSVDPGRSGFAPGSPTNTRLKVSYQPGRDVNLRRPGYPDDISIVFDDVQRDTGLAIFPWPARPAKFRVIAHSEGGDRQLDFIFNDVDLDSTLSRADEYVDLLTYATGPPSAFDVTWHVQLDTLGQALSLGDTYELRLIRPFSSDDVFVFSTSGSRVDPARAQAEFSQKPYVVPNPYLGAAGFEPERFAVLGRGERRIEFRALPRSSTVRIYTVRGDLVQTLRHDGSDNGYVAWNLRTKDNLDVAPGLYIFHVDAPGVGTHTGKFAVVK